MSTYILIKIEFIYINIFNVIMKNSNQNIYLYFSQSDDFIFFINKYKFIKFNNYYEQHNTSIRILELMFNCNNKIECIPSIIISIIFGDYFNQPINNLPNTINKLKFSYGFNQLLNYLPNSIISIEFICSFKNNLYNLPNSIKIIFGCSIVNCNFLPSYLEELTIINNYSYIKNNVHIYLNRLPKFIKKITIIVYNINNENKNINIFPKKINNYKLIEKLNMAEDYLLIHYIMNTYK